MTRHDWSPFDTPGVFEVVRKVAVKAAWRYEFVEIDDITQEAALMVASRRDLIEAVETGQLGLLYYRLWCDVVDSLKGAASTEAEEIEENHSSLNDIEADGWSRAGADVERLDYAAWFAAEQSESFLAVLGVRKFTVEQRLVIGLHHLLRAVDHEVDRRFLGMEADAGAAWQRAELTQKQRRAVILICGRGLSRVDAARVVGVDESTMRRRFDRALELLVAQAERSLWAHVA